MSVESGEPIQVTQDGGFGAFESTDGKFVYYMKDDQITTSLWKVPVGGGEETEVLESVYNRNFSVTPQGIYFIPAPDTDEPDRSFLIRFFDFATGRATTIHSLPPGVRASQGLTVSPDGRSILYTQVDQSQSDLIWWKISAEGGSGGGRPNGSASTVSLSCIGRSEPRALACGPALGRARLCSVPTCGVVWLAAERP